MTDGDAPFDDRELCRIAAFHVWEAAKRVASVRSRVADPILGATLDAACETLRARHRELTGVADALPGAPPRRPR